MIPESRRMPTSWLVSYSRSRFPPSTCAYRSSRLAYASPARRYPCPPRPWSAGTRPAGRFALLPCLAPRLRFSVLKQPFREGGRLGGAEVGELDAPADVEGGGPGVLDQLGGAGDSQQAEGQARKL